VRNQVSGGVLLLNGGNAPQAKSVTHQAPLPLVEILESAELEPAAHADEADAEDVAAEEQAAEEQVAVAPSPSTGPNPAVKRDGLSPLQKDLLARAQMKSDDPNRAVPPGGVKVS
jgi:hypothetical protein